MEFAARFRLFGTAQAHAAAVDLHIALDVAKHAKEGEQELPLALPIQAADADDFARHGHRT